MTLSFIMPTYNGMRYLREAVSSLQTQSDPDWALHISDDGSNDGTRAYLATLTDPRIKVYLQPKNLGIFGNLNFLFEQVQTPLSYILCQDDYLCTPEAVSLIKAEWSKQPAEVAFIRFNHSTDCKSALERFEKEVLPSVVHPSASDLLFYVFGCIPGNLSNVGLKTSIVGKHGWFDTSLPYAGDFEFWARVGRKEPWAITSTKVVKVREHAEQASMTLNKRGELLPQLATVLTTLYKNLVAQGHGALKLQAFATLCYVSMHRYAGLRQVLKGRSWKYVSVVGEALGGAAFSLPLPLAWLLFGLTLGGKTMRVQAAKTMLAGRQTH